MGLASGLEREDPIYGGPCKDFVGAFVPEIYPKNHPHQEEDVT